MIFHTSFSTLLSIKNRLTPSQKGVIFSFGLALVFLLITFANDRALFASFLNSGYGYGYGYSPEGQDLSWNKVFGGQMKDTGWKIKKTLDADAGYIAIGTTESSGAGESDALVIKTDPLGEMKWEKTFGGSSTDIGRAVIPTRDGGYLLAIESDSVGKGSYDAWIIKINAKGETQWEKTFGSASSDSIEAIQELSTGGYVLAGWSMGLDSYGDGWLLQIDLNGNKQWEKTFGGSGTEYISSLVLASDRGYLVAGYTNSWNSSCTDGWLIKTDEKGNQEWSNKFGGSGCDEIRAASLTSDGGYILTGVYKYDTWLLKIDSNGRRNWEEYFGGPSSGSLETGWGVAQTLDQGYIVAGSTTQNNSGSNDGWLIKTDGRGKIMWDTFYGTTTSESFSDVTLGVDSGYALVGSLYNDDQKGTYFWMVKTDRNGNAPLEPERSCEEDPSQDRCIAWSKTFGSSKDDQFFAEAETSFGGMIFAGMTQNTRTGYKDGWMVKTNSLGDKEWERNIGGRYDDEFRSVKMVSDGYIAVGYTSQNSSGSSVDGWMVKLDFNGFQVWDQRFGGEGKDYFESVSLTSDGGFVMAGNSNSESSDNDPEFWLVKANRYGNLEWENTWSASGYPARAYAAEEISGGFMIAGTFEGSDDEGFVILTDSNGNLRDADAFGGSGTQQFFDAKELFDGGFVLVGFNQPKAGDDLDIWVVRTDAKLNKLWEKSFSSLSLNEDARSVSETSDRGMIIAGVVNDMTTALRADGILLKLDQNGDEEWLQLYGGTGNDIFEEVILHSSGGYMVAGYTNSFGDGGNDGWVVRTDFEGNAPSERENSLLPCEIPGNPECMIWNKIYGGNDLEGLYAVQSTSDGGSIHAGFTGTYGVNGDGLIAKFDAQGNQVWLVNYGTHNDEFSSDYFYDVSPLKNGGYVLAGNSYWGPSSDYRNDGWLMVVDSAGRQIISQTLGGDKNDSFSSVEETSDGGYILLGTTDSYGDGDQDIWALKTNSLGSIEWSKTFGGVGKDIGVRVHETTDKGYIIAGYTDSYGAGSEDAFIVKIDPLGNEQWERTFGGEGVDFITDLVLSSDGGFTFVGATTSFNAIYESIWVIKMNAQGAPEWDEVYNESDPSIGNALQLAPDDGYIITASSLPRTSPSYDDALILKVNKYGMKEWSRIYGGDHNDVFSSVSVSHDGGYVFVGSTRSYRSDSENSEAWALKTDAFGNAPAEPALKP